MSTPRRPMEPGDLVRIVKAHPANNALGKTTTLIRREVFSGCIGFICDFPHPYDPDRELFGSYDSFEPFYDGDEPGEWEDLKDIWEPDPNKITIRSTVHIDAGNMDEILERIREAQRSWHGRND